MTRFPNGVSSFVYSLGSIKTLPQSTGVGAAAILATISGGRILLISVFGKVTTVIQTQANNTKLQAVPTGLTAVDMCAVLDITAKALGSTFSIDGTPGDALISNTYSSFIFQATPWVVQTGTINLNCAASNTGAVQWTFLWTPIDPAAKLVAS